MEELNTLFRALVKKYHPDKVRDYPEWAHERMAEINIAYELLAQKITELATPEPKPATEPTQTDENENFEDIGNVQVKPLSAEESQVFYSIFNEFLDGLGLYYQYGLENPSYRNEGVRRFRFREALRMIIRSRDKLDLCKKTYRNPAITAASRFSRLTVADIDQGMLQFSSEPHFKKYDRRLFNARRTFDKAVKVVLFPELVPGHQASQYYSGIYSCYPEFIIYLNTVDGELRRKAGILQAARYDAFMSLVQLRNSGVLHF